MDVPTQGNNEKWINQVFGIPTVPANKREHYPFSRDYAFRYRLKVLALLSLAAYALYRIPQPCLRLSILLNCWLAFVTCETLYKNYPWREPLNWWLWTIRLSVPHWGVLATLCLVLLPVSWNTLGTGCKLPYPQLAAFVGWLCLMVATPLLREYYWTREAVTPHDYDQYSSVRPSMLTWSRPIAVLFATLKSPSLLALAALIAFTWSVAQLLPGWAADVWTQFTGPFILACLAVLCCHRLPVEGRMVIDAWEEQEADYALQIETALKKVKASLRRSMPKEGTERFDRFAIQVPLLQREAAILRKESLKLDESKAKELETLATIKELDRFRKTLDSYGPYTKNCCVS